MKTFLVLFSILALSAQARAGFSKVHCVGDATSNRSVEGFNQATITDLTMKDGKIEMVFSIEKTRFDDETYQYKVIPIAQDNSDKTANIFGQKDGIQKETTNAIALLNLTTVKGADGVNGLVSFDVQIDNNVRASFVGTLKCNELE